MSVKAFEIICVEKFQISSSISCFELCGKDLYIGCQDGLLHHFLVEEKNQPVALQVTKRDQNDLEIKKPIIKVKCASALNRLLILCDGSIHILNTFDLQCVRYGIKIKSVVVFCVNENPLISNPFCLEICVARRRSVHLYHITEESAIHTREISLSESPIEMAMDGKFVCVALPSKYAIVNWEADTVMEVLPYDATVTVPLVIRLNKEEFLINGPNALGIFVTSAGTSERPPLLWAKSVQAVAFTHPYILTLHDDHVVVYSILDQKQKQRIHFQGGTHLEHFQGRTLAVSGSNIYILMPVPCEKQVRALLADGNVAEALNLAKNFHWPGISREQFLKVYKRIQQEAGFIEFSRFNFTAAKELFIVGHLDPRELVCLYPELIYCGDFMKSVPPLHSIVNVSHMCHGDAEKIRHCCEFLLNFLQAIGERRNNLKWKKELDVVFIKLFAQLDPSRLAEEIVSFSSSCASSQLTDVISECTDWLKKHQRYHALALFMKHVKADDEQAIDLWMKLLGGDVEDETFPGSSFVIGVLANLQDENVLWKHAHHLLQKDPKVGVQIFIDRRSRLTENENDDDKVVEFLHQFPSALINFLEYLIFEQHLHKEKFHTQLAILYLEKVRSNVDRIDVDTARKKLQQFLRLSSLYRVNFVLGRVEGNGLYLEEAILYGKLEEHERALKVLVHTLNDPQLAREHCEFYSRGRNVEFRHNLFRHLLAVYLDPQLDAKRKEELFQPAIELVNSGLGEIDAVSYLELLPDQWSATVVNSFLINALRRCSSKLRSKQVEKNLAKVENVQMKWQNYLMLRNPIRVTEDVVCAVCGKTLDEAVVTRFPAGQLTHVSCSRAVVQKSS